MPQAVSERSSPTLNIAIGLRGVEAFTQFTERPGGEIDFRQVGYLFLLDRAEDVPVFEESVALQNELGVPSRVVDPEEAGRLSPLAGLDGVLAATFCALDGHASPEAVAQGYAAGARAHGAAVVTGCTATASRPGRRAGRRRRDRPGNRQDGHRRAAPLVWSPEPREDGRRRARRRARLPRGRDERASARRTILLTVDFTTGFTIAEGPGLLIGMSDPEQPSGFDAPTDPAWLERVTEVAARRAPSFLDMGVAHGWKGYYEVTPDHNALVGEAPHLERFLYATGPPATASCRRPRSARSSATSSSAMSRSST